MVNLAGYDPWKQTPPADDTPPASDPHESCDRTIAQLEARVRALEAALAGATALRFVPVPRCENCSDGRPNSDCTCRGTASHCECAGPGCGAEMVHGYCLEAVIAGRRPLRFCGWLCAAKGMQEEVPRPVQVDPALSLSDGDDIPW